MSETLPSTDLLITVVNDNNDLGQVDTLAQRPLFNAVGANLSSSLYKGYFDREQGTLNLIKTNGQVLEIQGFHTQLALGIGLEGKKGKMGKPAKPGRPGSDGEEGCAGCAGPMGLEGERGLAGKAGLDGRQGPEGPEGCAGLEGERGPPGPQGGPGVQGPRGPKGPSCVRGPRGPAGPPPITRVVISPLAPAGHNASALLWGIPED